MDQGSLSRDRSTSDLPRHESCFCRSSSMFVIILLLFFFISSAAFTHILSRPRPWLSEFEFRVCGQCRDIWHNHQLFSEASQAVCSPPSIHVSLSIKKPTLVLFHACYQTFLLIFNKKLNSLDPWLKNDLRRWRSTGRTGMISRFVGPLLWYIPCYDYLAD